MIFFNPLQKKEEFLDSVKVIRTFNRFKTVTIRVKKGRPEILCPHFTSKSFLRRLLKKKTSWIKKKMQEYTQIERQSNKIDQGFIKLRNRNLKLIYRNGEKNNFELKRDRLLITLKKSEGIDKKIIIKSWLKSEANKYLKKRSILLSKKFKICI